MQMTSPGQKDSSKDWGNQDHSVATAADSGSDVAKVLQTKRWQMQEGPFRGFNSPPGRF